MIRSICAVLAFFALGLNTAAQADEPVRDLALVVFVGQAPENIDVEDIINPVAHAIKKLPGTAFRDEYLTKEFIPDYQSPEIPGNCVFNAVCLRQVREAKGIRHFFLIKIIFVSGQVEVEIYKITDSVAMDLVFDKKLPPTATNIINFTVGTIAEAVKPPPLLIVAQTIEAEIKPLRRNPEVSPLEFNIEPLPSPKLSNNLVITGWVVTGVGAILAGIGTYYQVHTISLQEDLEAQCAGPVCGLSRAETYTLAAEIDDSGKLGNGLAITGWVVVAGGVATAIAGHILGIETDGVVEISPVFTDTGGTLFATWHF